MKQGWKRLITLALVLVLAGFVAPMALNAQAEGDTSVNAAYGQVTADDVKVRKQATKSAQYWFELDKGFVCEILDVVPKGDVTWYRVNTEHPGKNGRTYIGYIHGDFFRVMTAEEVTAWKAQAAPTATPEGPSSSVVNGYVQLKLSSANLRETPGGDIKAQWEKQGEILPYYGKPIQRGEYCWFNVVYQGRSYYVRSDTVQTVTALGAPVTMEPAVTQSGSATPKPATSGYVKMIKDGVNHRIQPAGEVIQQIDRGTVVRYLSTKQNNSVTWYYVEYKGIRGYIREDCVAITDASGFVSGQATPAPTVENVIVYGYVKMIKDKVNLREKPVGSHIEQLSLNLIVPVVGAVEPKGRYDWYKVQSPSGHIGYVRDDCLVICNADGTTDGASLAPIVATPTPAPTTGGGTSATVYGYVQLTKSGVNLRKTMGGAVQTQLNIGTVWPMTGKADTKDNVKWYPISANGYTGYVRGDCAYQLSQTQVESYLAGNGIPKETPTVAPVESNYLITTVAAVNLRAAASKDAAAPYNVSLGTVMAYDNYTTSGGAKWYRVVYNNTQVWVLETCVSIMTQAEYDAWAAANPGNTPQPAVIVGYVKTTIGDLNVRDAAGGSKILTKVDKDVVMPYMALPEDARGRTWYYVLTPNGTRGYIDDDYLTLVASDGSALPTNTPGSSGGSSGSGTTGQEATYETLRVGSTGEAVLKLTTELRIQGYYTGEVTNVYTTAVRDAVKAFQTEKGLSVDGVAGPVTQHTLFGTVPAGSGTGDLTMTIYPAEKIDWWTGGIQQLWPKGDNYKIYDVKTGIVWWAHRWSGGKHADIEPLTAADTARLCKIYGVASADKINNKQHWHRRPSLVTIGSHTYACSLYGVPHNEKGDTIDNNDMIGQICLHFTNSRTHDSDRLDSDHQEAVEYAWKHAPNGYLPYNP